MKSTVTVAIAVLMLLASSAFGQVRPGQIDRSDFGTAPEGTPVPSTCAVDDEVNQPLVAGQFSSAFTSDSGVEFLTADNATAMGASAVFSGGPDITEVTVWGLQLELGPGGFIGPCDADQADFTIGAWTDGMGLPDVLLDSATASPTVTDLQIPFALGANVHEFTIPLPSGVAVDGGATWFSVQREPSPDTAGGNQCAWLWVNTTDVAVGDNQAVSIATADGTVFPRTEDTSACVTTGQALPESVPVPADTPWALMTLMLVLLGAGLVAVRRIV